MIRFLAAFALVLVTSGSAAAETSRIDAAAETSRIDAAAETSRIDAATESRAYLCSNIAGSSMVAPAWRAEPDRATGQQVLIHFKGSGELASVKWMNAGTAYYEGTGPGTTMRSGFSIAVVADEFAEMYVFDAGTRELFYTQTRSGSPLLPNSMKFFKASCNPAAAPAR